MSPKGQQRVITIETMSMRLNSCFLNVGYIQLWYSHSIILTVLFDQWLLACIQCQTLYVLEKVFVLWKVQLFAWPNGYTTDVRVLLRL